MVRPEPSSRTLRVAIAVIGIVLLAVANIAALDAADFDGPCPGPGERIFVRNALELRVALGEAEPGDLIELASGTYEGQFRISTSGTPRQPIVLCGPRSAILDTGNAATGYGLHIQADHWIIKGITVRNALKGIVMDRSNHVTLSGIEVYDTGTEGIRLRDLSSDNRIEDAYIHDTGLTAPVNGEGIYIGTANSQWCLRLACAPDTSDRNVLIGSVIGPNVTAEAVDIKEGSTGGTLRGNTFDGSGMGGADSWVDLKGNGYLIVDNRGVVSSNDGLQIHSPVVGWGQDNVIRDNHLEVRGPGHGIWVGDSARNLPNVLGCSNVIVAAAGGDINVPCQQAD